ncbi:MAG: hypothetical protein ND866_05545, partial [Pyrinomonadaceae bacterium]|nr:hypothetical protein [Pyrinomonadaceae bacterium]
MNVKKLPTANAPRKLSDNIQEFNKHPGRHFVALLFVASLVFSDLAVFAQSGQNPQATPAPV